MKAKVTNRFIIFITNIVTRVITKNIALNNNEDDMKCIKEK